MCGIAGILSFKNSIHLSEIKSMTDKLVHRGPDGEGQWVDDRARVGLGQRRLSIIDLSENGKQPMFYDNGNLVITFNGEIYNYIELSLYMKMVRPEEFEVYPVNVSSLFVKQNIHILPS